MMGNILASWGSSITIAVLLGIGLAMDAFGISITHGFKDPQISRGRTLATASTFGIFQGVMPLIGWGIVFGFSSIKSFSYIFSQIVPPLAFVILAYLGIKMIINCVKNKEEEMIKVSTKSFFIVLLAEGIATSIDALSSGLAMNDYSFAEAGVSALIIALITFTFSLVGVYLGKKVGDKAGSKAEMIGGIILIIVGTFILIKGEIKVNAPYLIPEWLEWLF